MLNLRDIATSLCASCSNDGSVFRNTFERAHNGMTNVAQNMAQSMTAQPTLNNDFNG